MLDKHKGFTKKDILKTLKDVKNKGYKIEGYIRIEAFLESFPDDNMFFGVITGLEDFNIYNYYDKNGCLKTDDLNTKLNAIYNEILNTSKNYNIFASIELKNYKIIDKNARFPKLFLFWSVIILTLAVLAFTILFFVKVIEETLYTYLSAGFTALDFCIGVISLAREAYDDRKKEEIANKRKVVEDDPTDSNHSNIVNYVNLKVAKRKQISICNICGKNINGDEKVSK